MSLLIGLFAVVMGLGFVVFIADTYEHNKWLNEREKYWDDVKKRREEKEGSR